MAQTALAAATAYAKVASARVVDNLCASLLKKLLACTTSTDSSGSLNEGQRKSAYSLMGLALSLVTCPRLSTKNSELLFRTLRPLIIADEDESLQKRAYRVLSSICQNHRRDEHRGRMDMDKGAGGSSPRVAAHSNRRRETESPHVPAASCMQPRCLGPGAAGSFFSYPS